MTNVSAIQNPQPKSILSLPNYNAVKIDIHNPQVNAPGAQQDVKAPAQAQAPVTAPMYSYPQSQIYEVPKQSIYQPQPPVNQPPAVQEVPTVPPPVIVQPSIKQTPATAAAPAIAAPEAAPATPAEITPVAPAEQTPAPAQTVDVKAPEAMKPQVDLNDFIAKLTNPDYEVQANAMESIADMAQNSPQKATELLDVKIVDTLLGIMSSDTSKLTGPTQEQLKIREKIMGGKSVTEAETAEANKITPMEQAERNKQYAIYTVAILQKLYGSEIEKMNNTVVPLTELPGAAGVVEQVKNNPNPMVRAAGIDALSYIQRPEYKQDLTTIFTIAKNDKDANVKQTATKALEKLEQIAAPANTSTPAPAVAEKKPEETKKA